jgi:lia operon protein LiaH
MAFKRLRNVLKATYHQIMDDVETPESMLKQYLRDIENEIITAKEVISKQQVFYDNFRRQQEEASQLVVKRGKQAQIATKSGEDTLANKALTEMKHYETKVKEYESYALETEAGIKNLREQLAQLQREYLDLLDKKNSLVARVSLSKAKQRLNATLKSLTSEHTLGEFQRIHDQIKEMEVDKDEDSFSNATEDKIDLSINQLQQSSESPKK